VSALDAALAAAIDGERRRQETYIELIASENYASPRVLAAQGSCLTNKYADGYPGHRTYSGCEFVDVAESLARERACALFGAEYANVQPYSGTQANAAAFMALLEPGDTILGMANSHGGHITHGDSRSFAGRFYKALHYTTDRNGLVDYEQLGTLAREHRPRMIIAGYSAYSRTLDWARFRAVADEVGAWLLVDMAHAAGLVAAGVCPNPVPYADVCTSTTHKTLRGPRGGLILARDAAALGARLDAAVYPGIQGGPLMHVVAAKAVAFEEAQRPQFRVYQGRVLANAAHLAAALEQHGFTIVTGGTDNHMMLVDLTTRDLSALDAASRLEAAHIAVSSWRLPHDSPERAPHGLRLGTPAVTTRGFGPEQMQELAVLIAQVVAGSDTACERARGRVAQLCQSYPVYGPGSTWDE
jgi:glycine hydroxymethyltransferase